MDDTKEHPDWHLITALGGAQKVAEMMGYAKDGGVQRVQNWKARGIPPAVKLERPDLFLPDMRKKSAPKASAHRAADKPTANAGERRKHARAH